LPTPLQFALFVDVKPPRGLIALQIFNPTEAVHCRARERVPILIATLRQVCSSPGVPNMLEARDVKPERPEANRNQNHFSVIRPEECAADIQQPLRDDEIGVRFPRFAEARKSLGLAADRLLDLGSVSLGCREVTENTPAYSAVFEQDVNLLKHLCRPRVVAPGSFVLTEQVLQLVMVLTGCFYQQFLSGLLRGLNIALNLLASL